MTELKDMYKDAGSKGAPTDEDILTVHKALSEAEVPLDNRMMYYYKISWWRHPIKRYRQKKALSYLLETTDD